LRAPTLLAHASPPPVLADARAPALLADTSHPPVLADLRAPALLAHASLPPVLADSFPRALLAIIPSLLPAVHARPIAPRPRGRARTLSEGRGHGGTRGGCDARLRRRARGTKQDQAGVPRVSTTPRAQQPCPTDGRPRLISATAAPSHALHAFGGSERVSLFSPRTLTRRRLTRGARAVRVRTRVRRGTPARGARGVGSRGARG
jgi:hypothetical protein